jgi:hypothetical protein
VNTKKLFWNDFCNRFNILNEGIPLFDTQNHLVQTFQYGTNKRHILKRSPQMDSLIIHEVNKVIGDYTSGNKEYEGLIYMMYWRENDEVIPLYIGKSEKLGKSQNLSENIKNIGQNKGKFCRWGYNYAYHIGDLSAVVCLGHDANKKTIKYQKWADKLFAEVPTHQPRLNKETFFWISAWRNGNIGLWKEYGETSLTFLEYLLIGVASDIFSDYLLNEEGVNRR